MNKITAFLLIIVTALSLTLAATMQCKAQSKSFAGIIPFVSTSDRLGFFDQTSGRVYMYDNNFSQCLFEGQIQELGQPIQVISKAQ